MAKAKKKRERGSSAMDVGEVVVVAPSHSPADDGMDTSEVVVTDKPKKPLLQGRIGKKGPQKRKALKLRKQKALMKAIEMIDKQEQRTTKTELKKYRKQTLVQMD